MHRSARNWRLKLPLALLATAFLAPARAFAGAIRAVRVWPSPEYTRITIESRDAIGFKHFRLADPDRLVVDLEGVEPENALIELANLVSPQDYFIANIRVARNRPGVTRLVAELKVDIKPRVFALKPMQDYGNRLVLDIYPANAEAVEKQIEAAIQQSSKAEPAKNNGKSDYVRLITIAIDAGHGGEDPGAIGASGTREKDITLSVAQRLKRHIDQKENMRAVLIRDGDYFIPLHERVSKARRLKADLFVSIHADAFLKPSARGSSVFALSEKGATSAAAKWLAKKENDADLIGGVSLDGKDAYLRQTLLDLTQRGTIEHGVKLGRAVLEQIGEINTLHKEHVEQAGFAVLKAPDIPSILIETAFISNPEEEKKLADEAYQDKMAAAITTGIRGYFDKYPLLDRAQMARRS